MSLFGSVGRALGLSGSGAAGGRAAEDLSRIAAQLRNFRPIRVRTGVGETIMDQEGLRFQGADPAFAAAQGNVRSFFGRATEALAGFDPRTAADRTLGLLRERRASLFDTNLSRLESRLLQQGRLGLGTGERAANPELAGFFAAEQAADLEAQLVAEEEARRQGAFLQQQAGGALGLLEATELPFSQGLFQLGQQILGRDLAAANIEAGGARLRMEGEVAEQDARAGFFTALIGSIARSARTAGTGGQA